MCVCVVCGLLSVCVSVCVYWEEEVRVCEFVLCVVLLGGGGPCV